MKFSINRQLFIKHLTDVQRAISSKTAIPILTGVKLELTDSTLTITGSDTNISIEKEISSTIENHQLIIEKVGKIVLPSRFFGDIVKKLSDNIVSIELLKNNKVEIKSGNSIFTINGVDADLYPSIEQIESNEQNTISLPTFLFKNVLAQTIIAASTNEQKPIFTGIHLTIENKQLTAVATDTHRMSKRVIELSSIAQNMTFNCTVPAKSLNELSKIIDDEAELSVIFSENKMLFISDNMYFYTRLLEGNYPDVSRLLKQEMTTHLMVNATDFLRAVDRVAIVSTESKNDFITLNLTKNNSILSSESSEIGYVEEKLELIDFKGNDLKISFNPNYMKDALRVLADQKILISFLDGGRPFTLKVENDIQNQFIQLITPVRTRN